MTDRPIRQRLLLWDIDGTLVHSAGYGGEVFLTAFERVIGSAPPERLHLSGKTDRQIATEYLTLVDAVDDIRVDQMLQKITTELAKARDAIAAEGAVYPGVEEVLRTLHGTAGVTQTLLTGNVPANAIVKVAAFDLDRYLDVDAGSYGHRSIDRRDLLFAAWDIQRDRYGRTFSPEETWIIGDTPNDLWCARSGGAHCLLVATGSYTVAELSDLGADVIRGDLSDVSSVVALLTGDVT